MGTFTSSRTSATDVAIRLQEVEAVLKGVLDKLADLTGPENPDLTAVNEDLDRLYKMVSFGSYTNPTSSDPRSETVFDVGYNSLFNVIFGANADLAAAIIATGGPANITAMIAHDTDEWFWSAGTSLLSLTIGYDAYGPLLKEYVSGASVASATFGNIDMLDAILGGDHFGNTSSNSIAFRVFGATNKVPTGSTSIVSMIEALQSRMSSAESRLSSGGL
jgi:hypothetical protein